MRERFTCIPSVAAAAQVNLALIRGSYSTRIRLHLCARASCAYVSGGAAMRRPPATRCARRAQDSVAV